MNMQNSGLIAAEERSRIGALLSRYPESSEADLAEIANWFDRVATPLDLGHLASDPDVAEQYRAYRANHLNRFTAKDIGIAAMFLIVGLTVVGGILVMAP